MSADVASLSQPRSSNPFEAARLLLIKRLLGMQAPVAYPNYPTPGHHEGVAAHIREAAMIFDEWLAAVGAEVRDSATTSIDKGLFAGSFMGAVDGNETWACESEAQSLNDDRRAMRRAS